MLCASLVEIIPVVLEIEEDYLMSSMYCMSLILKYNLSLEKGMVFRLNMHVPEFHHPRDNILAFKFDETDFNHPYLRTV